MNNRFLLIAIVLNLVFTSSGCTKIPDYWPTRGWRTSTPEAQGMDSEVLVKLLDYTREQNINMHSMTIIRHGYVVFDAYFWPFDSSTLHDIASCTKSITSTLVGIAQDKEYLDINQPMLSLFPDRTVSNLDIRKQAITVKDLLTMTSGLQCITRPFERTLIQMRESPDWVQYALDQPVDFDPGSNWVYNSPGSHILSAIITQAAGMSASELARANLFDPLGIDTFYWPRDPQGINHGWGDLRITPHDMAKIGYLYLHNGRWDGKRILSSRYIRQATRNQTGKKGPEDGYGYLWWTYKLGTYHANGRGGQRIFVAPILDLIVVTTAGNTPEQSGQYEKILGSIVLPAIKKKGGGSLPDNPDAFARLQARIEEVGTSPSPQPVPPLPQIARDISGKTWILAPNPLGWETVKLEFEEGSNEAYVAITSGGIINKFTLGLDDVPRITSGGSFVADSRYSGQNVALKGYWSRDTFVIDFNALAVIDRGTIKINSSDDSVNVELFEKTFMGAPVLFTGRLKE